MTRDELRATIRAYLRDEPQLNALLDGYEHTDEQIDAAITMAISDWHRTPPILARRPPLTELLNDEAVQGLFIMGGVVHCLRSAGILQMRNRLDFNDAGLTVASSNKMRDYLAFAQEMAKEYSAAVADFKYAFNLHQAWSSVLTSYSYLPQFVGYQESR